MPVEENVRWFHLAALVAVGSLVTLFVVLGRFVAKDDGIGAVKGHERHHDEHYVYLESDRWLFYNIAALIASSYIFTLAGVCCVRLLYLPNPYRLDGPGDLFAGPGATTQRGPDPDRAMRSKLAPSPVVVVATGGDGDGDSDGDSDDDDDDDDDDCHKGRAAGQQEHSRRSGRRDKTRRSDRQQRAGGRLSGPLPARMFCSTDDEDIMRESGHLFAQIGRRYDNDVDPPRGSDDDYNDADGPGDYLDAVADQFFSGGGGGGGRETSARHSRRSGRSAETNDSGPDDLDYESDRAVTRVVNGSRSHRKRGADDRRRVHVAAADGAHAARSRDRASRSPRDHDDFSRFLRSSDK